jgi:hypothetical protein
MKKTESFNSLNISYMLRLIEGFRFLSVVRSAELLKSIIRSLNNEEILAAGILARSLLELVVRNLEAVNTTYHNFKSVAWDRMRKDVVLFSDPEIDGKRQDGLMTYVEKMLFGTRIKAQAGSEEEFSTKTLFPFWKRRIKCLKPRLVTAFLKNTNCCAKSRIPIALVLNCLCQIENPSMAFGILTKSVSRPGITCRCTIWARFCGSSLFAQRRWYPANLFTTASCCSLTSVFQSSIQFVGRNGTANTRLLIRYSIQKLSENRLDN